MSAPHRSALPQLTLHTLPSSALHQVATRNAKATQRWYHRESAMRSPQHSARLVDILYNLNEIDFELDRALSLDDAWPSFAPRSFSGGAGGMLSPLERSPFRSRGPGSAVSGPGGLNSSFGSGRASDNISLASGSAVDFDQISYTSLDHSQLQNLEQLQSEKELAEQEKKAAIEVCLSSRRGGEKGGLRVRRLPGAPPPPARSGHSQARLSPGQGAGRGGME